MPPQPPGSQTESSSHPALSQSPMPQDRGKSLKKIAFLYYFKYNYWERDVML